MKYAVIRVKGKQYRVSEGMEVLVDKATGALEPEVVLVVADEKVKVGKPLVKDSKITLKVLKEEEKGEKVDVYKFKAKSRYRRHTGFTPKFTRILVQKIA